MLLLKIFCYALLFAIGTFAYVRFYETKLLFLPSKRLQATPADVGLGYEDVFLKTSDQQTLNGWLIKASPKAATIIFLHGNAGNISHRLDKIALLYKMGLNVFILDYRGYGKSQGTPSEPGIYLDAQAAYDYVKGRNDLKGMRILLYGESVGGAAAIDLAKHRQVDGLIAESTFSSAKDMARVILPFIPPVLVSVKLDSVSKLADLKAPKLFIHSRYDEIVPFRLGQKLFQAAAEPKEFLEIDGDHNEGYALSYQIYFGGIKDFLEKYNLF